jgi:tetratricopeptide (TPR) repeat protein
MKAHKFTSLLLLFLLSFFKISIAQPPTGSGRQAFLQAEEMRKQNKCADAINRYEEAIKAEPNNYKYWFQKGLCEQKEKRIDIAKQSFTKSIELNKEFTPAYAQMAKIFKDEKDIENTISFYEQAANNEKQPGRKVQYELILVNLLIKQDKVFDAKRHWEEAQKLDPNNIKVHYYAGEIKAADNDWAGAKEDYLKATEVPEFNALPPAEKAQYYYALGLSYNKLNDLENAKKAWSKASIGPFKQLIEQQLMKSNHQYYYKVAASYYLNDEFDDAEVNIQKALEINPTFSAAHVLRGRIARKKNDLRGAAENYERAIEAEKEQANKAKLYVALSQIQMLDNNFTSALSSLEEAIAAIPGNKNLQYMRAKAQYGAGRYADAIRSAEELISSSTDQKAKARFSFLLGVAAKRNGDKDKAKVGFQGAMFGSFKPAARIELDKLSGKDN